MSLHRSVSVRHVISSIVLVALSFPPLGPGAAARGESAPSGRDAAAQGPQPLGNNLRVDRARHRVIVTAKVCLRKGDLEQLLCLAHTKEHEAILSAEIDPKTLVAALFLIGAQPGHTVRYDEKSKKTIPPSGSPISIDLEWIEGGKTHHASAREWVRNLKTGKPLQNNWVFASDGLYRDPMTGEKFFLGDEGDLITVSNFTSSILDLPIESSESNADHSFQAFTEQIPNVGTPVTVILQLEPAKGRPAGR